LRRPIKTAPCIRSYLSETNAANPGIPVSLVRLENACQDCARTCGAGDGWRGQVFRFQYSKIWNDVCLDITGMLGLVGLSWGQIMKTANCALALAVTLGVIALVAPRAVRADDIVNVTISNLTINGSNVCGASGTDLCSQTVSESFQWDNSTNSYVSGSLSYTTSGVYGSTLYNLTPLVDNSFGVLQVDATEDTQPSGNGATLGIILADTAVGLPLGSYTQAVAPNLPPLAGTGLLPNTYYPYLSCYVLDPCVTKSWFAAWRGTNPAGASMTVSSVPEPSSLLLLGVGLLGLMGGMRFKRLA
jgi:hypothetical protein